MGAEQDVVGTFGADFRPENLDGLATEPWT